MGAHMTALKLLPEFAISLLAVGSWVVLVFNLPEGKAPAVDRVTAAPLSVARNDRPIEAAIARASEPGGTRSTDPAQINPDSR